MARNPKVSIVIPSWNRKEDLRECLKSIKKQSYKNFEVIVVENGSNDGTKEMLKKEFKWAKVIQNKKNLGVSIAKNQGIKAAKGEYIWFLDSDSEIISKETLKEMVKRMGKNQKIGAIGGEIRTYDKGKVRGMIILKNGASEAVFVPRGTNDSKEVDFLVTANCFVRKDLLEKIGGFDPGYFYFGEDKELGYRIKKLGYKNIINGKTGVLHKVSPKTRVSKIYTMYKNTIRFAIKNFSLSNILLLPVYDILYLLRPKTHKQLKEKRIQDIAGLKAKYKEGGTIKKYLIVGLHVFFAIIYGYIWNLINLRKTLKARFNKQNYLK